MNKLPFDIIRIIIEYTDNIDLRRYYCIYNKINLSLYNNLYFVLWKDMNEINISRSIRTFYNNKYYNMNLLKIINYNLHNIINFKERINTNDFIKIYYSESYSTYNNNKLYMKEIYIHRLKNNFDELSLYDKNNKYNKYDKNYNQNISDNYYDNCYWDIIISTIRSNKPFI